MIIYVERTVTGNAQVDQLLEVTGLPLPPLPKLVLQFCMVKSFHESGCSFHLRPSGGGGVATVRESVFFDYFITEGAIISFQYGEMVPSKIAKGTKHLLNSNKSEWRYEHGSQVGYRQNECWEIAPDTVWRLLYLTNLTPLNYPTKTQFETPEASCNSALDG
ncbi:hypothetical protein QR685DRAFT_576058 [Neurospora intermedia]|uniref:Uncharacterized protein n=1 Tax=Neurospora intermedia TaxID=5142 RepID=A0ABR3CYN7_NEUIN